MRRRIGLIIAAAAVSLLSAVPGQTVGQAALAGAEVTGQYALPQMVVPAGQGATFANLDPLAPHDIVSVARVGGPTSARRFRSAVVDFGQTSAIEGVATLAAGDYAFFCSVHPNMTGTLKVA